MHSTDTGGSRHFSDSGGTLENKADKLLGLMELMSMLGGGSWRMLKNTADTCYPGLDFQYHSPTEGTRLLGEMASSKKKAGNNTR